MCFGQIWALQFLKGSIVDVYLHQLLNLQISPGGNWVAAASPGEPLPQVKINMMSA